MNFRRTILALKISFLLSIFAAATFYFQYVSLKKAYSISCSQDQSSDDEENAPLPIAEEESENEKSSTEEEEQDDDRLFNHLEIIFSQTFGSTIARSTIHLLDFKEIHFEIVTPPPQS